MSTISLTLEEAEWLAYMVKVNDELIERSYVIMGPDGGKHLVFVFNENYLGRNTSKLYETWSPITRNGVWRHYGEPMPNWVTGLPMQLLTEDGFSLEELEKAEEIMEKL